MARLPALVSVLARLQPCERSLVDYYGRTIRGAGLITMTKRGVGAAHVTARDAANLLIALNTADIATDAPAMIRLYRPLRDAHGQTFGDMLEHLIINAPHYRDEIFRTIESNMGREHHEIAKQSALLASTPGAFRVTFVKPEPRAFVKEHVTGSLNMSRKVFAPTDDLIYEDVCKPTDDDRFIEVSFGLRTLLAVNDVLGSDEEMSMPSDVDSAA